MRGLSTLPAETPAPSCCSWQRAQPRAIPGEPRTPPRAYRDRDRDRQPQGRGAASNPEMVPGQGEGLHGAAPGPWHWCPATPRSDPKHQVPWPRCCAIPPPPNHSDTPSIPHALTCRHHKCLPQPNASLALGLPREHPGAAGTDPRGHRPPRHNEGSDPTHSGRGGSDLTCTMGTPSPRTSRGTDLTCRAGTPTPRARRRHPHAHMAGTPTPHARRGHRPGSASPAASSPPPPTPHAPPNRNGGPWGCGFGSSPMGGGGGDYLPVRLLMASTRLEGK